MNELKKADKIVRALREAYKETDKVYFFLRTLLKDAADLIENRTSQLAESQRREKAAVEDINLLEDCGVCKHHDLDSCDLAGTECHFEWRGPQEAEKGEADGN